jgi:alpha-glucosidase
MTEAYASIENQVRWYGSKDGKILGAHMPFNFALIVDLDKNSNADAFQKAAQKWLDSKPEYGIANWVLGNHVSNN